MASYTNTNNADEGFPPSLQWFPKYFKQAYRKNLFTLTLSGTSTGIAAGNIIGASAAQSTQFGLINPSTSTSVLVLTKFAVGYTSGSTSDSSLFHGYLTTPPTATSPGGTIRNNYLGDTSVSSVARAWASAGGSTATGGSAPITFRAVNNRPIYDSNNSVIVPTFYDEADGDIIIPPGIMWLPLWGSSGSSLTNSYSVSWYEVGV